GGAPPAGLPLDAANSYQNLVMVASSQEAGLFRVNPGMPDTSYLINKLENTQTNGTGIMPPSGMLPQQSIDTIRQWITDGAEDDRVVVLDPVRIQSIFPVNNAQLQSPPAQVMVSFDREVNPASVDATTFFVTASTDGAFGNGDDVVIPVAPVVAANMLSATIDLSGQMLGDDTYQVTLLGDGGNVIMDLDGNALDGENVGVLPSGNTTAGGDWMSTYTVATPPMLEANLDSIQQFIFTPRCASCHTGNGAVLPGVLNLTSADNSFNALVNQPAIQEAFMRVAPNDAQNSYLIIKMENRQAVGGVMPPTGMLPQADIDVVRQWIDNGAVR
ncbi:MAG: Ig-like domain-containing protein, partial [Woeseiaceae bacterium]|nr:Ig-like domain-containing protein [Woeseiaceae bacterium]